MIILDQPGRLQPGPLVASQTALEAGTEILLSDSPEQNREQLTQGLSVCSQFVTLPGMEQAWREFSEAAQLSSSFAFLLY